MNAELQTILLQALAWSARASLILLVAFLIVRSISASATRYRLLVASILLVLIVPMAALAPSLFTVSLPSTWLTHSTHIAPAQSQPATTRQAPLTTILQRASDLHNASPLSTPSNIFQSQLDAHVAPKLNAIVSPHRIDTLPPTEQPATPAGPVADSSLADSQLIAALRSKFPTATDRALAWSESARRAIVSSISQITWPIAALLLWSLGLLAVIAYTLMGVTRLSLIARDAQPADSQWGPLLAHAAASQRIRRPIRLLQSDEISVPLTFGLWRPVVLLPESAAAWSDQRRRVVLTHELIHIRRLDYVVQLATWAVVALHWFNPLAWWALRAAAVERERSCDAAVLRAGARPTEYAEHLLDVARSLVARKAPAPALAMGRASELEGRIMNILSNPKRNTRRSIAATIVLLAAGCAAAAVAPELVPPEQEAAFNREAAELDRLEQEIAARRARLEAARIEAAAKDLLATDARDVRADAQRAKAEAERVAAKATPIAAGARPAAAGAEPVEAGAEAYRAEKIHRLKTELAVVERAHADDARFPRRVEIKADNNAKTWFPDAPEFKARLAKIEPIIDPVVIEAHTKLESIEHGAEGINVKLAAINEKMQPAIEQAVQAELRLLPHMQAVESLAVQLEAEHKRLADLRAEATQIKHNNRIDRSDILKIEQAQLDAQKAQLYADRLVLQAEAAQLEKQMTSGQADPAKLEQQLQKLRKRFIEIDSTIHTIENRAAELEAQAAETIHVEKLQAKSQEQHLRLVYDHMQHIERRMHTLQEQMEIENDQLHLIHEKLEPVMIETERLHREALEPLHKEMESVHMMMHDRITDHVVSAFRAELERDRVFSNDKQLNAFLAIVKKAPAPDATIMSSNRSMLIRLTHPDAHAEAISRMAAEYQAKGELSLAGVDRSKLDAAIDRAAAKTEIMTFATDH